MKNIFSPFAKLVAVAACALTLGSCNRAEYALLPKGASYHGTTRVATPVPVPAEASVELAPKMVPAPVAGAKAPKPTKAGAPASPIKESTAPAVAAAPARKLNPLQRLALSKVARKLEKVTQKATAIRHNNTAATSALDGKLRQGLILLLVGLLIGIVGGAVGGSIGNVIGLLGLIVVIIGIVLIILYLLDSV